MYLPCYAFSGNPRLQPFAMPCATSKKSVFKLFSFLFLQNSGVGLNKLEASPRPADIIPAVFSDLSFVN